MIVFYFLLLGAVLLAAIAVDNVYPEQRNTSRNFHKEFFQSKDWNIIRKCDNHKIILKHKLCDGKKDCSDGSDETKEKCSGNRCSSDQFHCSYGACISKKFICDGKYECADGSDEASPMCVKPFCKIPCASESTEYLVKEGADKMDCSANSELVDGSLLFYRCKSGYYPTPTQEEVSCKHGSWVPNIPQCIKDSGNQTAENPGSKPANMNGASGSSTAKKEAQPMKEQPAAPDTADKPNTSGNVAAPDKVAMPDKKPATR